MPSVSVIIPHYNRSELIRETLLSVQSQDFIDWEVIVVDDGSEPSEWLRLQSYANKQIQIIQRNSLTRGPGCCRNEGLALARGEFVIFLDSDDILSPNAISNRYSRAVEFSDHDFWVFSCAIFKDKPGDTNQLWNSIETDEHPLIRFLKMDGPWCVSSGFWRKSSLIQLGGFNEKIWYGDDAALHIHALLEKLRYQSFPDDTPDCFIRRSDVPRTTNCLSDVLIRKRFEFLREIQALLKHYPDADYHVWLWRRAWFAEAEYLMFIRRYADIPPVKRETIQNLNGLLASFVELYFYVGEQLHRYYKLLFRIWRRAFICFLPSDLFSWTNIKSPSVMDFRQWSEVCDIFDDNGGQLQSKDKVIKLWFTDFWGGFDPRQNWFVSFLSKHFTVELSPRKPDFLIYSCFGFDFLRYSCTRIFFTAENVRPDYRYCDYAFSFDYDKNPKNYRLPLYRLYFSENQITGSRPCKSVEELLGRKFCNMVVSNPNASERIRFFHMLSDQLPVDSGGRTLNNIGYPVADKRTFIKDYKFSIAFENSAYPGYLTEKLFEPWMEYSVPIYWGDPLVENEINPDCFINVSRFCSYEESVDEVIRLQNNSADYIAMVNAPLFRNNRLPSYLKDKHILARFDQIFIQDRSTSTVDRRFQIFTYYLRHLKRVRQLLRLSRT